MQRQRRSTIDSLPEQFEMDISSASNNSLVLDPQVCWNNMLSGQNLADYLLAPVQPHATFGSAVNNTESGSSSSWNFDNSSSSGFATVNDSDLNGVKMDHNWTSLEAGPSIDRGTRFHEGRPESNHTPPLENVDANISSDQASTELGLFHNITADALQNFHSNNAPNYLNDMEFLSDPVQEDSEADASDSLDDSHSNSKQILLGVGSSYSLVPSPDASEHASEDGDNRRLSCKRKNVGGVPGQSSAGASSSVNQTERGMVVQSLDTHHTLASNLSVSGSFDNVSFSSTSDNTSTIAASASNPVAADRNPFLSGENAENSQRNFRLRINPAGQRNTSLGGLRPLGNSVGDQTPWHNPSSLLPSPMSSRLGGVGMSSQHNPFSILPSPIGSRPGGVGMSSQMQPHLPIISGPPQYSPSVINALPNSRLGGPSTAVMMRNRFGVSREEANVGNMWRSDSSEPPFVFRRSDMGASQTPPVHWGLSGGSTSSQENMASTPRFRSSSGRYSLVPPGLVPLRIPSNQSQLSLEFIRQSISSTRSNSAAQSNPHPQQSSQLSSSHTAIPVRGVRLRSHQQSQLRFPSLLDRQNDAANGGDVSALMRERRTRMLSEIRNMLGALRRGENLRFEDVILDHSVILGAVDLHDRHRDMRLDVDNMSYEELLALEERMGNVSTGLSEEAVLKCLKQRKHSTSSMEESVEIEPCCICQEDFVAGEKIGRLDCGHDFHIGCIKQWLMQKNICPICKAAALAT